MQTTLTREDLAAVLGEAVKAREDFRVKLREIINDKTNDPFERGRLQFELLVKAAVETFGPGPEAFYELANLVRLGAIMQEWSAALATVAQDASLPANDKLARALNKTRLFLPALAWLFPGYFDPELSRLFQFEHLVPAGKRPPRRAAEAVALSLWFFHHRRDGKSLEQGASDICRRLFARGIKRRTPQQLIRFREEIDCDAHRYAVENARRDATAAAELCKWTTAPPAPQPTRAVRKTADQRRHRMYDRLWPIGEAEVRAAMDDGRNHTAAVDEAVETLLDRIKPRPSKTPRPSAWTGAGPS